MWRFLDEGVVRTHMSGSNPEIDYGPLGCFPFNSYAKSPLNKRNTRDFKIPTGQNYQFDVTAFSKFRLDADTAIPHPKS